MIDPGTLAAIGGAAVAARYGVEVFQRVTRAAHLESGLQADGAAFRLMYRNSQMPKAIVAASGAPVSMNPTCQWYLGNRIGQPFVEWSHPHEVGLDLEKFLALMDGEIASYQACKRWFHSRFALPPGHPMRPNREPDPDRPEDWVAGAMDCTRWGEKQSRFLLGRWLPGLPREEKPMCYVEIVPLPYPLPLKGKEIHWGYPLPDGTRIWEAVTDHDYGIPRR